MKLLVTRTFILLSVVLCLTSCSKSNPHPADPLEGINREIYGFNRVVDKAIIRPTAYFYYAYTPKEFQSGVHNFFGNINTIPTIANDFLQFKFGLAAHDISRFLINSTIGLGGWFDPAHKLGLVKRQEDFGQTLYRWGVRDSIYVVLPIIGPSTVRDTVGMVADAAMSVWPYLESDKVRYIAKGVEVIDLRASFLRNETVLESVGVDEYAFVRNAYLQRRQFAAYDGSVPLELQDTDPFDEDEWFEDDEDVTPGADEDDWDFEVDS